MIDAMSHQWKSRLVGSGNPITKISYFICILFISLSACETSYSGEINIPYKGITLNANLELASGKQLSDGVILITHAGLAHNGMEIYVYLQNLLKERGYNSLAINVSFGISNRHGMLDCNSVHRHLYTDAVAEINHWLSWLKTQGVSHYILLGHSRGGAQTALFASENNDPLLRAVILLAPDTRETNNATAYQNRHKQQLAPFLKRAQSLVANNKSDTLLEKTGFLYCQDARVSAATFVSYYEDNSRLDTAHEIPGILKPVLLIIAGNDQVLVNNKKFLAFDKQKNVTLSIIDGADHFFRDLFLDDAVDEISSFLENLKVQ